MKKLKQYKRFIFIAIIFVTLGVTFRTTAVNPGLGVVLIAVGGLFFIIGMNLKKQKQSTSGGSGEGTENSE